MCATQSGFFDIFLTSDDAAHFASCSMGNAESSLNNSVGARCDGAFPTGSFGRCGIVFVGIIMIILSIWWLRDMHSWMIGW